MAITAAFSNNWIPRAFISSEARGEVIAKWGWIGEIFFAMMIFHVLMLSLIRRVYNRIRTAKILRNNNVC